MSFTYEELQIIVKLMQNNCNGTFLTTEELEVISEAMKQEIESRRDFSPQEKETFKILIDAAKEQSKRR